MSNPNQDNIDKFEQQVWEKVQVKLEALIDTHITKELLVDELGLLPHQVRPVMDKLLDFWTLGCDAGYKGTIEAIKPYLEVIQPYLKNHETI